MKEFIGIRTQEIGFCPEIQQQAFIVTLLITSWKQVKMGPFTIIQPKGIRLYQCLN